MSDIPSDLYKNILSKLPTESLLIFRGVSKSWCQIIDEPAFIKSHIENHHYQSEDGLGQLLVRNEKGGKLLSLSLDFIKSGSRHKEIEATQVKNLVRRGLPRLDTLPVSSCNGLILIPHDSEKVWVLWNPLTQEYYELPLCEPDFHLVGCGLGYDSANDDYKVVRITRTALREGTVYKTLVYSLRFDSWKRVKDCPDYISFYGHGNGQYLNGVLYWLSKDSVIAFDLITEDYRQLPLPPLRPEYPEQREDWVLNLDVLGGFLVFSCNYMWHNNWTSSFKGFKGWVMKDDGGDIKWAKLFSLSEELEDDIGSWKNLRPITYCKRTRRVLLQNDHIFYWLNTKNNSAKKVRIHGLRGSSEGKFSCQVWQGSIFRLGNVVAAKRIERVKKKMRAKKRLEFETTIIDAGEYSDSAFSCYSSSGEDDY